MPQPFNYAVITNGGIALLTKAQAGECKIEFTRMVIGDGTYSADEQTISALQVRTELKSERNSYEVSSISVHNDTSVKVTALLTNEDPYTGEALITDGYYVNEIGLYAKEAEGTVDTEVMYSIATTSGEQGDYMPAYNGYNPAQITQSYYATVANSADVTLEVENDGYVLKSDFDDEIQYLQQEMLSVYYEEETETLVLTSESLNSGGGGDGAGDYILPTATTTRLGGIKIGSGLKVQNDGTTSVDFSQLADDPDTAAEVVDAGTEVMTEDEVKEAFDEADN